MLLTIQRRYILIKTAMVLSQLWVTTPSSKIITHLNHFLPMWVTCLRSKEKLQNFTTNWVPRFNMYCWCLVENILIPLPLSESFFVHWCSTEVLIYFPVTKMMNLVHSWGTRKVRVQFSPRSKKPVPSDVKSPKDNCKGDQVCVKCEPSSNPFKTPKGKKVFNQKMFGQGNVNPLPN